MKKEIKIGDCVITFKKPSKFRIYFHLTDKCECGGLFYNVDAYRLDRVNSKIKGFHKNLPEEVYNYHEGVFCIGCGDVRGSWFGQGLINYTKEIREAWLKNKF
jgi:hypothetical protein